jgi:pimeloyl-ACP methyl ester carboxylesterase
LAGAEDALCPPEMQIEMALALPSTTLELIRDAGHFALLEQPATVARHIAAWLDRVDGHVATRQLA